MLNNIRHYWFQNTWSYPHQLRKHTKIIYEISFHNKNIEKIYLSRNFHDAMIKAAALPNTLFIFILPLWCVHWWIQYDPKFSAGINLWINLVWEHLSMLTLSYSVTVQTLHLRIRSNYFIKNNWKIINNKLHKRFSRGPMCHENGTTVYQKASRNVLEELCNTF